MKKIILFLSMAAGYHLNTWGQAVVNSTGNILQDASHMFEYSIGEIGITTVSATTVPMAYVTQGLLQPNIKLVDPACQVINDTVQYFPNPTRNILSIATRYDWITGYRVYAADGKLLRVAAFINNQIDLSNLPAGYYFIRILPGCDNTFRTLKVIKQ